MTVGSGLQILYNRPTKAPLKFEDLKALADTLQAPPHLWTESQLWQAYAALDQSKVKGASRRRILTDHFSLVRYAMHQENELVPYPERVAANFKAWVREHGPVSREDIDKLLLDKLPEVLTAAQKVSKVHNLISSLAGKAIRNVGTRQAPRWVLIEQSKQ